MNVDLTTPRHSLLKPHGPQLILSPTRSGHHIPVAHVSPLIQDPPEATTETPFAVSSRPNTSNNRQLSMSKSRRTQQYSEIIQPGVLFIYLHLLVFQICATFSSFKLDFLPTTS